MTIWGTSNQDYGVFCPNKGELLCIFKFSGGDAEHLVKFWGESTRQHALRDNLGYIESRLWIFCRNRGKCCAGTLLHHATVLQVWPHSFQSTVGMVLLWTIETARSQTGSNDHPVQRAVLTRGKLHVWVKTQWMQPKCRKINWKVSTVLSSPFFFSRRARTTTKKKDFLPRSPLKSLRKTQTKRNSLQMKKSKAFQKKTARNSQKKTRKKIRGASACNVVT